MESDEQLLQKKSAELRQALKVWEKQFATNNAGRKAGRDDIKANPSIAARYSEYSKLRDILSGTKASNPEKRRAPTDFHHSPPKRSRSPLETPSKPQKYSQIDEHSDEVEFATPAVKRTIFGPTPQKDGQFMGIFDILPNETPSRVRTVLENMDANMTRTPSKRFEDQDDGRVEERLRGSRTPLSTGKRFLLDSFVTPKKRSVNEATTPSLSMKEFATPSFLRRDIFNLSAVIEEPASPEIARPWKRRSFGRSLSGMVKDLRDKERQKEDEEWELMREMEETGHGEHPGKKSSGPSKALVEDSQQIQLDADGFVPSGFDSEVDAEAQDTKPRKAYKKKGMKRQTRRTNIKPVLHRPQPAQVPRPPSESEDEEEQDVPADIIDAEEAEVVQETQFAANAPDSGYLSGQEDGFVSVHKDGEASDDKTETGGDLQARESKIKTISKAKEMELKWKADKAAERKKGEKKGDPHAKHVNFQRLKMRGKGPVNGRVGGQRRFGKRR